MLSFEEAQRVASRLRDELGRRIVGQQAVVEEILTVFVAGGHCLLRGAQLDLFMFNIVIDYPSAAEEHRILAATTGDEEPAITPVATAAEIDAMRHLVREVPAASNVIDYALRIVRASRPAGAADDEVPPAVRQWVKWGAGPRAGQALVIGAKGRALLAGRSVASAADIRAVALPVLRHRVLLNFQAEADGIDADQIVGRLLEAVREP